MVNIRFRKIKINDYEPILRLLNTTPGVTTREADSRESLMKYLKRNPGISHTAVIKDRIVGFVMGGHDGRRGYLHHLVVMPAYRNKGIGTRLVQLCLDKLEARGIVKSHIDVFSDNEVAIRFWERKGWQKREDILRFSFNRSNDPNV